MDLFAFAYKLSLKVLDFKLRSQFSDAVQSISANIAEGYGRRSLPEYLQFLYIAKGSLAESLTRIIGLKIAELVSADEFDHFDQLHYEIENKLLKLIETLEAKRRMNEWSDALPPTHKSKNPSI